jgi:SPX domain protein involved in polyphosphate accumulation
LKQSPHEISKNGFEIEFFKEIKSQLKDCSNFFSTLEEHYSTRFERIMVGYNQLKQNSSKYDKNACSRLLKACVNLYKDVLQLENFAITNYCGYSKILKKHDKLTQFSTREAFMRNVMSIQNFTQYPSLMILIKKCEDLYADIQNNIQNSTALNIPLKAEEQLFIDMIGNLKHQHQANKRKHEYVSSEEEEEPESEEVVCDSDDSRSQHSQDNRKHH